MVKKKKEMVEFKVDEFPKAGVTAEGISKLKGAFPVGPEGVEDEIVHTFAPTQVHEADTRKHVQRVTAASSSDINDGAAAIVLASGEAVEKYGLKPMAKLIGWGQGGVDPKIMGVGPVSASRQALTKAGLKMEDIDLWRPTRPLPPSPSPWPGSWASTWRRSTSTAEPLRWATLWEPPAPASLSPCFTRWPSGPKPDTAWPRCVSAAAWALPPCLRSAEGAVYSQRL